MSGTVGVDGQGCKRSGITISIQQRYRITVERKLTFSVPRGMCSKFTLTKYTRLWVCDVYDELSSDNRIKVPVVCSL